MTMLENLEKKVGAALEAVADAIAKGKPKDAAESLRVVAAELQAEAVEPNAVTDEQRREARAKLERVRAEINAESAAVQAFEARAAERREAEERERRAIRSKADVARLELVRLEHDVIPRLVKHPPACVAGLIARCQAEDAALWPPPSVTLPALRPHPIGMERGNLRSGEMIRDGDTARFVRETSQETLAVDVKPRQLGLRRLVDRISDWVALGYVETEILAAFRTEYAALPKVQPLEDVLKAHPRGAEGLRLLRRRPALSVPDLSPAA